MADECCCSIMSLQGHAAVTAFHLTPLQTAIVLPSIQLFESLQEKKHKILATTEEDTLIYVLEGKQSS